MDVQMDGWTNKKTGWMDRWRNRLMDRKKDRWNSQNPAIRQGSNNSPSFTFKYIKVLALF